MSVKLVVFSSVLQSSEHKFVASHSSDGKRCCMFAQNRRKVRRQIDKPSYSHRASTHPAAALLNPSTLSVPTFFLNLILKWDFENNFCERWMSFLKAKTKCYVLYSAAWIT